MSPVRLFQSPITDLQQPDVAKLLEQFVMAAIGLGLYEFREQSGQPATAGGVAAPNW